MLKKIILLAALAALIPAGIYSQERFERLFYSDYYVSVENTIRSMSHKHAIYSYIVANASTPEIDLFALLPEEDKIELQRMFPMTEEEANADDVILEFVLSKMAQNSKRLQVLTTIWGNKAKTLKNVVSLGKGG